MLPFRPEPVGGRRPLPQFQRKIIAKSMKEAEKRNKRLREENDRVMEEFRTRFDPPSRWRKVRHFVQKIAAMF